MATHPTRGVYVDAVVSGIAKTHAATLADIPDSDKYRPGSVRIYKGMIATQNQNTRDTQAKAVETERFYVSKLRGKPRLYRRYQDEAGVWHNQVLPATSDDLETAEGVEHAVAIWRHDIVSYPCAWCGAAIEMTLQDMRFFHIHMFKRYKIGAFPTCSKECAEKMVQQYAKNELQQHTEADP